LNSKKSANTCHAVERRVISGAGSVCQALIQTGRDDSARCMFQHVWDPSLDIPNA
jgi:hypothetical protein